MDKKTSFSYKLPDMSGVTQGTDRGPRLPNGEFELQIERIRPNVSRAGKLAIIAEFTILEVVSQQPTSTPKHGPIPPVSVGQRVDHYFALGEEYGYGEKEWAGLMDSLGVPVEERNAAQDGFLGDDNLAMGQRLRIRKQLPKTFFAPSKGKSAA